MTTFSSTLLSRSKARPFSGSSVLADDREAEGVELDDEVPLGLLGEREVRQALEVVVVGRVRVSSQLKHCPPVPGAARCSRTG